MERIATTDSSRDREFVELLQQVGLARELDGEVLATLTEQLTETRVDVRRMDLLEHYYRPTGDGDLGRQRASTDRVLIHKSTDRVSSHDLVSTLSGISPEVPPVKLQRIGGDEGPLVLHAGENFSAITDDETESFDPGTVSVRSLVRAFNGLIARTPLETRFIPLVPDDNREIYVSATKERMLTLARGGCVEPLPLSAIDDFAFW